MAHLVPHNAGNKLLDRRRQQAPQPRVITANQDHSEVFDPHAKGVYEPVLFRLGESRKASRPPEMVHGFPDRPVDNFVFDRTDTTKEERPVLIRKGRHRIPDDCSHIYGNRLLPSVLAHAAERTLLADNSPRR